MYGNEISEYNPNDNSSRCTTGRSRATRNAKVNRCQPRVGSGECAGVCVRANAHTTSRYVTALKAKKCHASAPKGDNTATKIGPITREPLISVEFNDMAPGRSCCGTSDGSNADHAGMLSAPPMPTPSCARKIAQIGASTRARAASTTLNVSITSCIACSHLRRSTASATTPAGIANNISGPICARISSATTDALPVRL